MLILRFLSYSILVIVSPALAQDPAPTFTYYTRYVVPYRQPIDVLYRRNELEARAESTVTSSALPSIVTSTITSTGPDDVKFTLASSILSSTFESPITISAGNYSTLTMSLYHFNTAPLFNGSYNTKTYLGRILALQGTNTVLEIDCQNLTNTSTCWQPVTITQGSALYLRAEPTETSPTVASTGFVIQKRQALGTAATPTITAPGGNYFSCSIASPTTSAVCFEQSVLSQSPATTQLAALWNRLNNTVVVTSTFSPIQVDRDILLVTAGYEVLGLNTSTSSSSFSLATNTPIAPTVVAPQFTQAGIVSEKGTSSASRYSSERTAAIVSMLVLGFVCALA